MIVVLARLADDNIVLWGALGDAKVGTRNEKVGCIGCAGPFLTVCTGKSELVVQGVEVL